MAGRLKALAVKALVWAALSLTGLVGLGAGPSFAQTYDFTFSGDGLQITNGVLTVTSGNITSVTGDITGGPNSAYDGTIDGLDFGSVFGYTSASNYNVSFGADTTNGGTNLFDFNDNFARDYAYPGDDIIDATSYTFDPAPAPRPGSGLLSYFGSVSV